MSIWSVSKALRSPIDLSITSLSELPYTISFVMRKRQQIDIYNELPKEKRPPDKLIWEGDIREINEWFDRILKRKDKPDGLSFLADEVE